MAMMLNKKDGSYDGETGARINESPLQNVQLRVDPGTVDGMADYQSGDKVTLTIEGRLGEIDENGMQTIEPTHVTAEPMNQAFKSTRNMMVRKPDMKGTALERMDEDLDA